MCPAVGLAQAVPAEARLLALLFRGTPILGLRPAAQVGTGLKVMAPIIVVTNARMAPIFGHSPGLSPREAILAAVDPQGLGHA